MWLALSAGLLLLASLAWYLRLRSWDTRELAGTGHAFLSPGWWDEPVVRGADAALPEISGKIFGVALQNIGSGHRLWIVGRAGFLAYSDDDGHCWTKYEYDRNAGEFLDSKLSSCQSERTTSRLRWPELFPTALASEVPPKQANPPPNVRQNNEQNSAPSLNEASPSKSQPSNTQPPYAQEAPADSKQQSPVQQGPPPSKPAPPVDTKQKAPVDIKQQGPAPSPAPSKETTASKAATTKPARAKVPPAKPNAPAVTSQAVQQDQSPPTQPPDLLAIRFSPNAQILSTNGLVWSLTSQNRWKYARARQDEYWQAGGKEFALRAPSGSNFATETWDKYPGDFVFEPPGSRVFWRSETVGAGLRLIRETDADGVAFYQCADCRLSSIVFGPDGRSVWLAGWSTDTEGSHGLILRSGDSGKHWQPVTRGALPPDRRIAAAGGRTWRWPPRWYLAVLLLSIALAVLAMRTPRQEKPSAPENPDHPTPDYAAVEECLTSDKPLAPGDMDVLGLRDIALGLSRFLRNEKTLPPLTIAATGEWGSGKSSLMNLLYCDLQSYGMRPVWFNAWHHQKEEHLLAALLQTIRLEAVPSVWSLLGVPFRYHLARQRVWRWLPMIVLMAAVTIFLFVLDWHLRTQHHTDLFMWVVQQFLPSAAPKAEPATTAPVYGGVIAMLAAIAALWKGLTAFGANPAALLASVAQGNKMKDLEAQTSFRQKFAVEFREVTRALGPKRPLVIFIDDLDRCLPGNVRDVLEAINFLVSSGDCFVVIGMDRIQVQRAVGLSFKDIAEEASRAPGQHTAGNAQSEAALADAAREKRADFAAKYLEKLVNLEIRIPVAGDDNARQALFKRSPEPAGEAAKARSLRWCLRLARISIPTALALLVLVGSWQLSIQLALPLWRWMDQQSTIHHPEQPASPISPGAAIAWNSSGGGKPPKETAPKAPAAAPETSEKSGVLVSQEAGPAPSFQPGKTIWPVRWVLSLPFYGAALFLLLVANIVLTTRPGVVTKDSQEFTDALEKVWYPLVLARQNTPRSAKRFINRVRYLAMRQRQQSEKASWWEQVLFPQRLPEVDRSKSWQYIPEPLLVALAAIEALEPQWIYNPKSFTLVSSTDGLPNGEARADSISGAVELLKEARARHAKVFAQEPAGRPDARWSAVAQYRDTFVTIWPRVFTDNQ